MINFFRAPYTADDSTPRDRDTEHRRRWAAAHGICHPLPYSSARAGWGDTHSVATARFVGQSLDALRQKSLRPFVHMATAHPDRCGNAGRSASDQRPVGSRTRAPSGTACRDGGGPLPRQQQRLAFRRREVERERGGASTSHIETSQEGNYGILLVTYQRGEAMLQASKNTKRYWRRVPYLGGRIFPNYQ